MQTAPEIIGLDRRVLTGSVALFLLVCGIGLFLPEPWGHALERAQVARGMLESGDYLVPRVGDDLYARLPPMSYWLIVLFGKLAGGVTMFVARLPSYLSAFVVLVLTYRVARVNFGRTEAALASLILILSPGFHRHCTSIDFGADMLLTAAAAGMLVVLDLYRTTRALRYVYTAGVLLGMAILIKYLVILAILIPVAAMYAWPAVRSGGRFRGRDAAHFVLAGLVAAAISLPWFFLMKADAGSSTMPGTARMLALLDPQAFLWGFLKVVRYFFHLGFPWSFLWPLVISAAFSRRSYGGDRQALVFLYAWAIPGALILLFCLKGAEHYIMPLYPVFSILFAVELCDRIRSGRGLPWVVPSIGAYLVLAAAAAAAVVAWTSITTPGGFRAVWREYGGMPISFGLILLFATAFVAWAAVRRRVPDAGASLGYLIAAGAAVFIIDTAAAVERASLSDLPVFASKTNALVSGHPGQSCLTVSDTYFQPTFLMPRFRRRAQPADIESATAGGGPVFVLADERRRAEVAAMGCEELMRSERKRLFHPLFLYHCGGTAAVGGAP